MAAPTTMIISVGGSPEPIVATIVQHRPEKVVFFASEETVELIGAIKERLRQDGLSVQDRKVMVPNAQDLVECYTCALACADLALEGGCSAAEVAVDFTGGTKAMTAALTLATVGRGFTFLYVGGRERTKDGRGVVVTGSEMIVQCADPFVLFQVEERKHLAWCFRTYQFSAAQAVVDSVLRRPLPDPDRFAFQTLRRLAVGYEAWERFDFQRAVQVLKATLKEWLPAVQTNPGLFGTAALSVVRDNVHWLERIQKATGQFQRFAPELIVDMVANAGRRADEGKYDDAVVRLYRGLELGGQVAVQRRLGCGTDKVPVEKVPEILRGEYRQRYEKDSGLCKLPLEATYLLLDALGEPEGNRFRENLPEFRKVQSARNHSWLAHGNVSATGEAYESLRNLVVRLLDVREEVRFPRLGES